MIADLISELFGTIGHTWKFKGKGYLPPTPEDVQEVLDRAAAALYDDEEDALFESAGIIVQKTKTGFDAFAYIGPYQ